MDFDLEFTAAPVAQATRRGWVVVASAIIILRLYRRHRYLTELLRRERKLNSRLIGETATKLIEAFSRGPSPRLRDLAQDIDNDFTLRP